MRYFYESRYARMMFEDRSNLDFGAHLHEHIEMGYVEQGCCEIIVDGKTYNVSNGEFFLIFPNQIHQYENSTQLSVKFMIFSPDIIPELKKVFLKKVPATPVIKAESDAVELLNMFWSRHKSDSDEVVKGFLLTIMSLFIKNIELVAVDKYNISTVKAILIYCEEHYCEPITIEDISRALHISRYHIAHIFKEKLNTTFSEYLAKKRIDYACGLLENASLSITDIAYESGFNSVRTFNRVFSKYMEITPREYRNRK